jgi:hypothetical protein
MWPMPRVHIAWGRKGRMIKHDFPLPKWAEVLRVWITSDEPPPYNERLLDEEFDLQELRKPTRD